MRHLYTQEDLRRLLLVACGALLACLAAAAAALLTVDPDLTARRIWRGYYTVLAEPEGDMAALARELALVPGIDAVVSRHTAEVSFNTFGGFKSITVSKIADRLDPEDPRRDPYLEQLDSMFRVRGSGSDWEVFYLRSGRARLPVLFTLSRVLSRHHWAAPDLYPGRAALRLLVFLAFAAVLILRSESWSAAVVLGGGLVPWLAAVAVGSGTTLLLGLLVMPVWVDVLQSFRGYLSRRGRAGSHRTTRRGIARLRSARRRAVRPAAALAPADLRGERLRGASPHLVSAALGVAAAALLAGSGTPLLPSLLPLLAGVLLLPLQYAVAVTGSLRGFHGVFVAVPILRRLAPREPWLTMRRVRALVLVAVALGASCVAVGEAGRRSTPSYVPAPVGGVWEPMSWGAMEKLAAASSGSRLPTLAGYLSHRAYQEALSFGRPYALPRPGERIRISRYLPARGGLEILRTERVVKRFQESWVRETLAGVEVGSVERLLLDQGFAALVLPGGEAAGALSSPRSGSAAVTYLAALAVVLFLAAYFLGRDFRLTPRALCVTTSLTLRRHQHPL